MNWDLPSFLVQRMNTLCTPDLFFVFSCKTQEVFDWWSKYDASRIEEANTAEDKVLIIK